MPDDLVLQHMPLRCLSSQGQQNTGFTTDRIHYENSLTKTGHTLPNERQTRNPSRGTSDKILGYLRGMRKENPYRENP